MAARRAPQTSAESQQHYIDTGERPVSPASDDSMRTNVAIVFSEDTLRRLRAYYGRGGRSTRVEVRRFVLDTVADAVRQLPAAKRRRIMAAAAPAPTPAVADDRICGTCRSPRAEHDRGKYCRVSRTVKPGSTFTPIVESA